MSGSKKKKGGKKPNSPRYSEKYGANRPNPYTGYLPPGSAKPGSLYHPESIDIEKQSLITGAPAAARQVSRSAPMSQARHKRENYSVVRARDRIDELEKLKEIQSAAAAELMAETLANTISKASGSEPNANAAAPEGVPQIVSMPDGRLMMASPAMDDSGNVILKLTPVVVVDNISSESDGSETAKSAEIPPEQSGKEPEPTRSGISATIGIELIDTDEKLSFDRDEPDYSESAMLPPASQTAEELMLELLGETTDDKSDAVPLYPGDSPLYPDGMPMYRDGLPVYPNGAPMYSGSMPLYPNGAPMYSGDKPVYSDGSPAFPENTPKPDSGESSSKVGKVVFNTSSRHFVHGNEKEIPTSEELSFDSVSKASLQTLSNNDKPLEAIIKAPVEKSMVFETVSPAPERKTVDNALPVKEDEADAKIYAPAVKALEIEEINDDITMPEPEPEEPQTDIYGEQFNEDDSDVKIAAPPKRPSIYVEEASEERSESSMSIISGLGKKKLGTSGQKQDDTLFLRRERPEDTTAVFSVPEGVKLPAYVDDDEFLQQWLDEGEDMNATEKRHKRRISAIIGAVTMIFALIGFIWVISYTFGSLSGIGNTDARKTELENYITPVVMSEVEVFETWNTVPSAKLLQSAVFRVLLNMSESNYSTDDTNKLIIPSNDIIDSARALYGEDVAIEMSDFSVLDSEEIYYSDVDDCFHVAATGISGPLPEVITVTRHGDDTTLVVGYLDETAGAAGATDENSYYQTLVFILTGDNSSDGYHIGAIRQQVEDEAE